MKVCWKISVSKRIPFGRMFTGSCCGIISTGNTGRHGEDGYRIDGILSLPDRYTRDPD